MRLHIALTALTAFVAAGAAHLGEARAEDWKAAFEVNASQADDNLSIVFTPKEGYYVNSAYPMKVELKSDAVKLDKTSLGKKDANYKASGHEGKASLATFTVPAKGKGKVDGEYKLSICTKSGCSPPLKGTFASK